ELSETRPWQRLPAGCGGCPQRIDCGLVRILVTGGAGFIGSHYVRRVLTGAYPQTAGAEVTVLDKLTYSGNPANLDPVAGSPRLRFVVGDICDPAVVDQVMAGQDLVVHFAAESHVDRSIQGAAPFVTTNVVGTQERKSTRLKSSYVKI